MTKLIELKKSFVTILAAIALLVGWYWFNSKPNVWHEKISLTVETPQGEVVASSVQLAGIRSHSVGQITPSDGRYLKGEAVVLKLPQSTGPKYLFALLKGRGSIYDFYPQELRDFKKHPLDYLNSGPLELKTSRYPKLVTFDNIDFPRTVKEVDPNDIGATFGNGYVLKSITLEITEEPITMGNIEGVLWWLENHTGRMRPPSSRLGVGLNSANKVLDVERLTKSDFDRKSK